ncbi:hypothetical protein evm_014012, partial [Chilo suppressalis]
MPSCVVKSCKNYTYKFKKSQGIAYHAFPRNRKRRNDWVLIIRYCRGDNNWNPSPASTVCSAHFDDLDFKNTAKGLRCLVPYAIPKRLLSNSPETKTQSTSPPIPQLPTPLLLLGDLNAHHTAFGCATNKQRGILYDMLDDFNLCILNDGSCTTVNRPHNSPSAIDVAFVSSNLMPSCNWSVFYDDCL